MERDTQNLKLKQIAKTKDFQNHVLHYQVPTTKSKVRVLIVVLNHFQPLLHSRKKEALITMKQTQ